MNGLPASNVPVTIHRMGGGDQQLSGEDQNGDTRNSGPNGEIYFRLDMPREAAEVELHVSLKPSPYSSKTKTQRKLLFGSNVEFHNLKCSPGRN